MPGTVLREINSGKKLIESDEISRTSDSITDDATTDDNDEDLEIEPNDLSYYKSGIKDAELSSSFEGTRDSPQQSEESPRPVRFPIQYPRKFQPLWTVYEVSSHTTKTSSKVDGASKTCLKSGGSSLRSGRSLRSGSSTGNLENCENCENCENSENCENPENCEKIKNSGICDKKDKSDTTCGKIEHPGICEKSNSEKYDKCDKNGKVDENEEKNKNIKAEAKNPTPELLHPARIDRPLIKIQHDNDRLNKSFIKKMLYICKAKSGKMCKNAISSPFMEKTGKLCKNALPTPIVEKSEKLLKSWMNNREIVTPTVLFSPVCASPHELGYEVQSLFSEKAMNQMEICKEFTDVFAKMVEERFTGIDLKISNITEAINKQSNDILALRKQIDNLTDRVILRLDRKLERIDTRLKTLHETIPEINKKTPSKQTLEIVDCLLTAVRKSITETDLPKI